MPQDISTSLLRLQYEEPSHFAEIVAGQTRHDQGFVAHLQALGIPCGEGPPLPRCSWIMVIQTDRQIDAEHVIATLRFALATPKDMRETIHEATHPGMAVDATYVPYRGQDHLITVLCDQTVDDTTGENAQRITNTPGRLGRAVEQGASEAGAAARHWLLVGAEDYWPKAIAEEQERIRQHLGEDPGTDDDFRSGLEQATE